MTDADAPETADDDDGAEIPAKIGATVYDDQGRALGTIRGFDESGFFVTTEEGLDALSIEHEHPGPEFGEGELMWRCSNCGEMGDVENVPDECPNCGAPREALYYWTED